MAFDYNGAIKAGYSDDEINKFLGFNYKGALDAGYSSDEINSYLDTKKQKQQPNANISHSSYAPPAPNTNIEPKKPKTFLDTIMSSGKKAVNAITEPIEYSADKLASMITGKSVDEIRANVKQKEDLDQITSTIASKQALDNGTFALGGLLKDNNQEKIDFDTTKQLFIQTAKNMGYHPMISNHNGEIKFGIRLKNGEIKDITPDFMDLVGANSREIIGSLAGTSLAVMTKNPASMAIGRGLLAGNASRALAYGMAGSGAGAMGDYIDNSNKSDKEITGKGLINSAIGGMANDALGAGVAEIISPTLKFSTKALKSGADKALDIMPLTKAIREQNVGGALKELEAQVGGKEALEDIIRQTDEMNTRVNVENGSYLAGLAKEELDNASKTIDDIEAKKSITKLAKEAISDTIQKAKDGIDTAQDAFFKSDKITKAQSDFIAGARANERVAQITGAVLNANATAANKMNKIITTDTNKILDDFNSLKADKATTRDTALAYEQRIKDEFNNGLNALEQAYSGVKTTIKNDEAGEQFLAQIEAIKNNIWGGVPNTKFKNILANLENAKEIDISGVNALRTELNRIIANTNDNNVAYLAKTTKDYIENDILDEILAKTPFSMEAKNLYQKMVSEYKDMKTISNSNWFKEIKNPDKGEVSINKAINDVVNERAPNNSVDLFLSKLNNDEISGVELNLIDKALDKYTFDMANSGKVIDINNAINTISSYNFKSMEAQNFINLLNRLKPIIGQDIELAKAIGAFKKGEKLSQGITHKPIMRIFTMLANRTIKTAIRLSPIIGRQPSLIHHVEQAILKSKNYDGFINNLEKITKNENIPQGIKDELNAFLKAQATNANEVAIKADDETYTPNFTMSEKGKMTYLDEAKFELDELLKDKTDIQDIVTTSLSWLKERHPEMFKNKRAVKELINYVIDSPDIIKPAKSKNSVYIGKNDGIKIKDIVINKDDNKIIHANSRKTNFEERKVFKADGGVALIPHTDTMPVGASGAKARSSTTDNIISQSTKNAKHDTFEPERKKELAKLSKQMKELTLDKQIANLLRLAKEKEIKDNELIKKLLEQLKKQTAKESIKNTINNK